MWYAPFPGRTGTSSHCLILVGWGTSPGHVGTPLPLAALISARRSQPFGSEGDQEPGRESQDSPGWSFRTKGIK